jgi:hypothetical protein
LDAPQAAAVGDLPAAHASRVSGELIQIDGNDHRWFEERASACSPPVHVDHAASHLMMLHFTATESISSYSKRRAHTLNVTAGPSRSTATSTACFARRVRTRNCYSLPIPAGRYTN